MSKAIKVLHTLRNNWKKTVFGTAAVTYGVHYSADKYKTEKLMVAYCLEASSIGHQGQTKGSRSRHLVVILNPAANKRKAKKNFEKYCAPLLHLAGITVDIIQTECEGQARSLAEKLDETVDGVVVAGGDGTLSEIVTGLLRKVDENDGYSRRIPVGVLPLGQTNTLANSLFGNSACDQVKMMADATMAVINNVTKPVDVIKVEVLETEDEKPGKPVYSLGSIKWGAFRDAEARRDKYWYWGSLRSYVSYIFMGLKGEDSGMSWKCQAELNYTEPCAGCSKCYDTMPNIFMEKMPAAHQKPRWWQAFVKQRPIQENADVTPKIDYSTIINDACGNVHEKEISTVDFYLTTANVHENCCRDGPPHIEISLGPEAVSYFEFVSEGWRRENKKNPSVTYKLQAKEVKLVPKIKDQGVEGKEHWISIDNEDYEAKPINVTLLPKRVDLFCTPENVN